MGAAHPKAGPRPAMAVVLGRNAGAVARRAKVGLGCGRLLVKRADSLYSVKLADETFSRKSRCDMES